MDLFENLQLMNEVNEEHEVHEYNGYKYQYAREYDPYAGECGEWEDKYHIYDKDDNYVCSCAADKSPEKTIDKLVQESAIVETKSFESEEIKYVLTARNMWSKDFSQRTSFLDKVYDSFEEAEAECREFQMDLASHMRAGIEKVKFDSDSNLIKLGSYWELFRGAFEKKSDDE